MRRAWKQWRSQRPCARFLNSLPDSVRDNKFKDTHILKEYGALFKSILDLRHGSFDSENARDLEDRARSRNQRNDKAQHVSSHLQTFEQFPWGLSPLAWREKVPLFSPEGGKEQPLLEHCTPLNKVTTPSVFCYFIYSRCGW